MHAGEYGDALALLAAAHSVPLDDAVRARIDLVRAEISLASNCADEALPLLLGAARRLEPLDARLARDTYLDALSAALFAGRLASGPGARQVAEAVRRTPPRPSPARTVDVLLEALAVRFTDGYAPAAPMSHRAVEAFAGAEPTETPCVLLARGGRTAASLWDDGCWDVLTRRHLELVRRTGALSVLPLALHTGTACSCSPVTWLGAASLVEETRSVTEATGSALATTARSAWPPCGVARSRPRRWSRLPRGRRRPRRGSG